MYIARWKRAKCSPHMQWNRKAISHKIYDRHNEIPHNNSHSNLINNYALALSLSLDVLGKLLEPLFSLEQIKKIRRVGTHSNYIWHGWGKIPEKFIAFPFNWVSNFLLIN